MSTATQNTSPALQELIQIFEQLPVNARKEVADFARFLLSKEDDDRWEELLNSPKGQQTLDKLLAESSLEDSEPMDFDKL